MWHLATGTLALLPGNNPVQAGCYEEYLESSTPAILSPAFIYNGTGTQPEKGSVIEAATTTNVSQTARGTCIRKGKASRSAVIQPLWILIAVLYGGILTGI